MLPVPNRLGTPLPSPLSSLVGRTSLIERICALLNEEGARLLTLTGPGGSGKTRLALAVAAALERDGAFTDGVVFIPLAALADPDHVLSALAGALNHRATDELSPAAGLAAVLRERRMLLVLDNFEHVAAAAPAVAALLAACPDIAALVTSRGRLRVGGERVLPVPPLELPGPRDDPSEVATSAAVRLLVARAQAVNPAIEFAEDDAVVLGEICRRLDGLPLAIELAAARLTHLGPRALLALLEQSLPLLTRADTDAPHRHRTMRDAIAWSHDLLAPEEQDLFQRLGTFAGGFTLEAAEYVSRESGVGSRELPRHAPDSVLDGILSLVDQSLLVPSSGPSGRFAMLETVREFALERLATSGEAEKVHRTHAAYFVDFAERHERAAWLPTPGDLLARFETEVPNMRAALASLAAAGEPEQVLRLAGALRWLWIGRDHVREGRMWLEYAYAHADTVRPAVRAKAAMALGQIVFYQGDEQQARTRYEEGLAAYRAIGDPFGTAFSLSALAALAIYVGDWNGSVPVLTEAIVWTERMTDGELAASLAASTTSNLGMAAYVQGDLALAAERFCDVIARYRALAYTGGMIRNLLYSGIVSGELGDRTRAMERFREGLSLAKDLGDERGVAAILEGVVGVAAVCGFPEQGARFAGVAAALRERVGYAIRYPIDRDSYERGVAAVRHALGEERFAVAWESGRTLPIEQSMAEALDLWPTPTGSARVCLSPRETQILPLLAAGRSDREIAESLFLSVRTVEHHVSRMLTKFGVRTRTAVTAAAIATGVLPPPATREPPITTAREPGNQHAPSSRTRRSPQPRPGLPQ